MPDPTPHEIMSAVTELRREVETRGFIEKDKIDRINVLLDGSDAQNQKVIAAESKALQLEKDVAELKDLKVQYEAIGKSNLEGAAELKGQVKQLEAEIARNMARSVTSEQGFRETDEYKALNEFCKVGYSNELSAEHKALLRTDDNVSGGFLATNEMASEITKKIEEVDPVRSVMRVRTTGKRAMDLPIRTSIPTATYEGEAETGADSTSLYELTTITPFRQTFTTPVTQDMLQDAEFDMDSEISSDAITAFAVGEGNGFVVGTGFKVPQGFASDATLQTDAREVSGGSITSDSIILLTGDLKVGYDPVYIFNRRTLALIRTFKATTNSYLWQPGLNGPVANTINGFPYVLANSMQDEATNAFPIAFGDFRSGYTIVDRTGFSVIRDEFTLKKQGIIEFTMNRWNTGQPTLREAIKLLKVTA